MALKHRTMFSNSVWLMRTTIRRPANAPIPTAGEYSHRGREHPGMAAGLCLGWSRPIAAPVAQGRERNDDRADHQPRMAIRDPAQGEIAEHDADGGEGKELPQIASLSVPAVRQHGDDVAEYQQRQHDTARLFAAGKNMVEQAIDRMLRPVMPLFETPTMKAPKRANIH